VIAAKFFGIKNIIYVINNITQNYSHPLRWFDYPIDFFVKKWVTIFITGSVYTGEKLKKTLKLDNKHQAIPNGIRIRDVTLDKEMFIKKYNIPQSRIIAGVVANLEKRKGHIFLFKAIKQIQDGYSKNEIPFFIIEGTGPEKKGLEKYIFDNQMEKNIFMIDHIPDIFNLFNASDMIILPSINNEDFPNVVLEAMSLGKPVIGTSIAGIPEQIENLKTGIIVSPQNAESLKMAIMDLALDPHRLSMYSQAAKKRFDLLYAESISINKYLELYRSLTK
jgi:glycosyltransferase involved in cell wall biosynthesis